MALILLFRLIKTIKEGARLFLKPTAILVDTKKKIQTGGGPQHIPTPLPTAFPTRFPTVNPHPDDVPNYNNKIYNGFQELIVVPIEFDNVKWNTSGVRAIPYQEIRAALQRTQDFFEEKSIGRMTFTGKDGHSYIEIMEPQLVTDHAFKL